MTGSRITAPGAARASFDSSVFAGPDNGGW